MEIDRAIRTIERARGYTVEQTEDGARYKVLRGGRLDRSIRHNSSEGMEPRFLCAYAEQVERKLDAVDDRAYMKAARNIFRRGARA